jgi:hypothetical protein
MAQIGLPMTQVLLSRPNTSSLKDSRDINLGGPVGIIGGPLDVVEAAAVLAATFEGVAPLLFPFDDDVDVEGFFPLATLLDIYQPNRHTG